MLLNFLRIGAQGSGSDGLWMPKEASTVAGSTDALFYFIYYTCLVFFVIVVGAMVYFVVKYRHKEGVPARTSGLKGNHTLEVLWTVIPGLLLVGMFGWGFRDWIRLLVPPANAIEVRVTGQKWNWNFDYVASGVSGNTMVVPENQPVKLVMNSKDVLHSFFVPAFRVKRDVLPGRYTVMWFEATERGEYPILCTEYCGTAHSNMLSKVRVVSDEEYKTWIDNGGDLGGEGVPLAELGAKVYEAKGCNACHSIDGSAKIGPSFKGIFGHQGKLVDGAAYTADDDYLRESILAPQAKVVQGFAPVMPSFQGQLNDRQLSALIEYMKTLK